MSQIGDHIPPSAAPAGCILVVDDDKKSQRLFFDLLKAQGYSVTLADDGEQALEKAFTNPPDVILLDVMMPNMDGYEVCRNLRLDPILAEVAIIMVTSLDDRAARLRGLDVGADDFITKPVDIVELLVRVRNVIQLNRYRKLLQERTKAQRAQAEIMSSCEATLAAWVRILERDGRVVPGRCDGVTQWALRLAKSAGMTDGDLGAARWSVLLHAIGAMAVPTALRGREDLSPEEEEEVHQEEAWIINALAPVAALRGALEILARRHEHWDGSGRPAALKGEAIPLAARVLAVALAWETNQVHKSSTTAARLAVLKAQAGRRFDPRLVEALEQTVGGREAVRLFTEVPVKAASVPAEDRLLPLSLLKRFSLVTTGVRVQFAVALALVAVIPTLIVICLCLTGWLGIKVNLNQLGAVVLLVLPFIALGCWMLARYPVNVTRLRRYMESLTQGVLPGQVTSVTGEDDLAAIESLMRKMVTQTETRAHTIESQSGALLDAERQRVMIQSLGAACHHLGQPATVITGYLEMAQRMALPTEAQLMLEQCRLAAADVADILNRFQRLTVYRSEPYLPQSESVTSSPNAAQLIKI